MQNSSYYDSFLCRLLVVSNSGPWPLKALSSSPIPWLPFQESAYTAQITLMPKEVGLLAPLGPETNGIRQSIHCLRMTSNERATEVNALQAMLLGVQIRDLANVVRHSVQ